MNFSTTSPDIANILAHQNARSVNLTGGVSVSLRSKLRFSDVDVERALLLHHCPLHRASTDAQTFADLQYARAALVKAHDALFQLGSDA